MNWKQVASAITSSLTVLAALPYQLGEIAVLIPPDWKPWVAGIGLGATTILRIWNGAKPPTPPEEKH